MTRRRTRSRRHVRSSRGTLDHRPTRRRCPRRNQNVATFARKRIAKSHKRLIDEGRTIKAKTPASQIHERRKTAKELRYLLECFAPLIEPKPLKRYVRRLKEFQDYLGEHQDADVHVARLARVATEVRHRGEIDPATEAAIGELRKRIERRRRDKRTKFDERFNAFARRKERRMFRLLLRSMDVR